MRRNRASCTSRGVLVASSNAFNRRRIGRAAILPRTFLISHWSMGLSNAVALGTRSPSDAVAFGLPLNGGRGGLGGQMLVEKLEHPLLVLGLRHLKRLVMFRLVDDPQFFRLARAIEQAFG